MTHEYAVSGKLLEVVQKLLEGGKLFMPIQQLKYPGCKWSKHAALVNSTDLQPYLPETELFHRSTFIRFINKYPTVFLKPSIGGGGRGVYRITSEDHVYLLEAAKTKRKYRSKKDLYYALQHRCGNKKYIIQQGIRLAVIHGRPFDLRVLLLKPEKDWKFIGFMGKIAATNYFVTNHSRGGKSIRLESALRYLKYSEEKAEETEKKLKTLSHKIAHSLNEYFYNITELGLDIALDHDGHIWLLEANTKPQYNLFKHHADKTLFDKIDSFTRKMRLTN